MNPAKIIDLAARLNAVHERRFNWGEVFFDNNADALRVEEQIEILNAALAELREDVATLRENARNRFHSSEKSRGSRGTPGMGGRLTSSSDLIP